MDRPDRQPGPSVDTARLQPDNQADTQHIHNELVSAWLDDPHLAAELAEERERLQRLQADEELLLALQLHQFTGRLWDRFARELARYGIGVLRAWICHGTIYAKAKALTGYRLGRIEGWPDDQTISDIANDTVAVALNYFRDKVLMTHRWKSSGGASLGTFFIGQCLYQFANIYRGALRAELDRIHQATTPMAELPEDWFDIIKGIEEMFLMIRTTLEALGGAQAVPSQLIPARELHHHLINQVATSGGNVVLADAAGTPAAVVMSIQRYQQLSDELNMLRALTREDMSC